MEPTKENLKEEIVFRIGLLEKSMIESSDNIYLHSILSNEHSMHSEFLRLIDIFEGRIGFEKFQTENYTPIKDYITKEPLKIGDKVKSNASDANGVLYFDDYLNRYVIKTEFGTHNKPSGFIKIDENFDYSIDSSKVECRSNPHKKRW